MCATRPLCVNCNARQHQAHQLQTAQCVLLEQAFVGFGGASAGADQIGGEGEGGRRGVVVAEPAGVHRQGDEQAMGGRGGERSTQGEDRLVDEPAGRLGGRVHQPQRAQVVLRQMMIDERPWRRAAHARTSRTRRAGSRCRCRGRWRRRRRGRASPGGSKRRTRRAGSRKS